MSAAVPYVAPWQSGFEKYATQIYPLATPQAFNAKITVADGQWWRVIYAFCQYTTSAVVGNRAIEWIVTPGGGQAAFHQESATVQPASTIYRYIYGPMLTAYVNTAASQLGVAVHTIPDMLWNPGTVLQFSLDFFQAGDNWTGTPTVAIEIYTEQRPGVLAPTPTPLLV